MAFKNRLQKYQSVAEKTVAFRQQSEIIGSLTRKLETLGAILGDWRKTLRAIAVFNRLKHHNRAGSRGRAKCR